MNTLLFALNSLLSVVDPVTQVEQWANSLHSFNGSYMLEYTSRSTGRLNSNPVEYRWQNGDVFIRMGESNRETNESEVITAARYKSKIDSTFLAGTELSYDASSETWPYPWGAYITPEQLFGAYHDLSPGDVVNGETCDCDILAASRLCPRVYYRGTPTLSIR